MAEFTMAAERKAPVLRIFSLKSYLYHCCTLYLVLVL